jgi:predicted acetyltransferase
MEFEIRPAEAEEMDQFGLMGSYSYAGSFGDGPDNVVAASNRPEWTLCAFDGPVMATSFAAFPFTMRANGNAMAFAGVSGVGTHPEYRRRGLLRKIMTQSFANMRDGGQAVAGLWASQAAIYQRYGYAMLGFNRTYSIDTVDIQFHDGDSGGLEVRRLGPETALDHAKAVYRAFIADRMCYLHRSRALWDNNVFDEVEGDGPVYAAVAFDGVAPRGYVVYTFRSGRNDHPARSQGMKIRDFMWLDGAAYRSLWSFIAKHDLVGRVVWENAPADDPAPELFVEPRMLNTQEGEGSWFRVVDVESALAERGYFGTGEATIEIVNDSLADWNNGTWHLTADPSGASIARSSGTAEAKMTIKSLSSLFTGMRSARDLASWSLLDADETAIAALDRIFTTKHAPHCADHY